MELQNNLKTQNENIENNNLNNQELLISNFTPIDVNQMIMKIMKIYIF